MQKMGWFGVAIGALIVMSSVTIRLPIQLYRNYAAILYLFRDIASYLSKVADFYCAMLCIRGTSHGFVPVCVRLSVRLSQVGVLLKRLNVGSHK